MLHVGLDLSRRRVDVCLISSEGELVEHFRAPADRDGLYGLSRRVAVYDEPVRGGVESMNGARFVHDTLEAQGWDVVVADAQHVKGLAPLACKTDKIDARVLAELSFRDLVPAIWLPDPQARSERELARFRLHRPLLDTTLSVIESVPIVSLRPQNGLRFCALNWRDLALHCAMGDTGLEPVTSALSRRRSPS